MKAPSWMKASCSAANLAEPSFWGCAMKCSRNRSGCRVSASESVETTTPRLARSAETGALPASLPLAKESVAADSTARAGGLAAAPSGEGA